VDSFLWDSLNGKGASYLQEMLEMCIGIFMRFATERTSLDHSDQCGFQLKKLELASITARLLATLVIEGAENSGMVLTMFVREGMIEKKRVRMKYVRERRDDRKEKGKNEMKGKINMINWNKLTPKICT